MEGNQKKWINLALLIIAILMVIMLISGCSKMETSLEPIKIGFIGPLTGPLAVFGEDMRGGVEVAIEEINDNGGINNRPLEVIYEDDACDSKNTVTAFSKLVNIDKVEAIIGPLCSGTVLSVAPLAEENKVIIFSPVATASSISKAGDYIFRNSISDVHQGKFLAEFLFKKYNLNNAGVIYVNNDYGIQLFDSFKRNFEGLGGNVKIAELYTDGSKDFRTNLAKIKNKNIDGLIIICGGVDGGLIAKQARELGIEVNLIGTDNFGGKEVMEVGGSAVEGTIFTTPSLDETNPELINFNNQYISKHGKDLFLGSDNLWISANAYDATMILKVAIEKGGCSSTEIKNYLYKIKDYQGIGGLISFDENGDVDKPLSVKIIKNGKQYDFKES